jgi:biotin transport system ATP-binding protein
VGGFDTVDEPATIRSHVSLVLANPDSQILMPTIGEDIDLSLATARRLRHKRPDSRPIPRDARQVLGDFGIRLEPDRAVSTLSGGQKQLVAIASVLATKPQLLLCDEPTTRLDLGWRAAISRLLLELPVPTVIATHDLELASQCERALVIHDGVVAWDGNPAEAIDFYSDLMSRRRTVQYG